MRHRYLFILLALLFCAACGDRNTPTTPTTPTTSTTTNATCSFTYKIDEQTVSFTNTSTGLTNCTWSFGDGSTSTEKDPVHTYEGGKYTVTLTGYDKASKKYSCSKNITIEEYQIPCPNVYITGYKLYKIGKNGKYYKVKITGTGLMGGAEDWGFQTVATPLLNSGDMPYTKMFSEPKLLDEIDWYGKYTVYVLWSNSENGSYTQILKQDINNTYPDDIYTQKKSEYVLTSNNGDTKIGILFSYK